MAADAQQYNKTGRRAYEAGELVLMMMMMMTSPFGQLGLWAPASIARDVFTLIKESSLARGGQRLQTMIIRLRLAKMGYMSSRRGGEWI
jgi:hypothetical protein